MARVMWLRRVAPGNYPTSSANWPAPWAVGWPDLPPACRAARESRGDELRVTSAFAHHLALDRPRREPARMDVGRVPLADLRHCSSASARPIERLGARPAPYLRLGHVGCHPVPGIRSHRIAGQSLGTLDGGIESTAGFRVVLHYDFVLACFSSASRMKGIVRRR